MLWVMKKLKLTPSASRSRPCSDGPGKPRGIRSDRGSGPPARARPTAPPPALSRGGTAETAELFSERLANRLFRAHHTQWRA
jgi:hypothetical protein